MRRLLQPRPCAAVARRTATAPTSSTRPSHHQRHQHHRLEQHQYHHHRYQQQHQQQQQQRLYSSAASSSHAWLVTNSSSSEDKRSGSLPPLPHVLDPSRSASSFSSRLAYKNSSSFAAVAAITSNHGRRNAFFSSPSQHQLRAFSATPPSSSPSPSSATPPVPSPPPPDTPAKKPTWKDLFKKYGPVFLIYWNGVWLLGGLSIYGALELGNVDPLPLARAIHLDALIDLNKIDPAHGNVAVAIILNEVAELVRFPFVLATVPKVTAWWDAHKPAYFHPVPRADGSAPPTWADLVKLHGPVFIVWWGSLWVLGAGGLFLGFEYHLFGAGVDALSLAREWGVDQVVDLSGLPPSLGNVGVAVACNEVLEVVRFPLALVTVKYWTRWWYRVRGKEMPK